MASINEIKSLAEQKWPGKKIVQRANLLLVGSQGATRVELTGEKAGLWFDFSEGVGGSLVKNQSFDLSQNGRKPAALYTYRRPDGSFSWIAARYNGETPQDKEFRPISINGVGIERKRPENAELIYNRDKLDLDLEAIVVITEGEKAADTINGLTFQSELTFRDERIIGITGANGAQSIPKHDWSCLAGRHVVLWPDNDEPGQQCMDRLEAVLMSIGVASLRRVSIPENTPRGYDIADGPTGSLTWPALVDLVIDAPIVATFEAVPAVEPKKRIELVAWDEIEDIPVKWLVDGLIPSGGFCALYGKPGSYKSFVALYLAAMIGTGSEAFSRETEAGDVVYVMGEGGAGLKTRKDALAAKYGTARAAVHFIRQQLNLRSTTEDADALIAAVREKGLSPKLIVIDTLARAFAGGNENASEDMGAFILQLGRIQDELKTAVLIVHHSGKDEARGQRGHSSLLGACDAELEVVKLSAEDSPDRIGKLTVTKQKDGEDGFEIGYRMAEQTVDLDRSSLVVEPIDAGLLPEKRKRGRKADNPGIAFAALKKAIEDSGLTITNNHIPSDARCVSRSDWRHVYDAMTPKEGEAARKAFDREVDPLIKSGRIKVWTNYCWISDA